MAVMLRLAGVPARVVLGYCTRSPDANGEFTVTSFDAHAWVEAYFKGIGWVPFDPTPIGGLDGGSKSDLAYAPHNYQSNGNDGVNKSRTDSGTSAAAAPSSRRPSATASTAGPRGPRPTGPRCGSRWPCWPSCCSPWPRPRPALAAPPTPLPRRSPLRRSRSVVGGTVRHGGRPRLRLVAGPLTAAGGRLVGAGHAGTRQALTLWRLRWNTSVTGRPCGEPDTAELGRGLRGSPCSCAPGAAAGVAVRAAAVAGLARAEPSPGAGCAWAAGGAADRSGGTTGVTAPACGPAVPRR